MATIHTSRARRTNPKAAKPRGAAPRPSDGIWLAGEQYYCERGPYRLLRTVPGLPEPFDAAHGENVYTRAAWDFAVAGQHGNTVGNCRIPCKAAELPCDG
jgi:hypothetical protein